MSTDIVRMLVVIFKIGEYVDESSFLNSVTFKIWHHRYTLWQLRKHMTSEQDSPLATCRQLLNIFQITVPTLKEVFAEFRIYLFFIFEVFVLYLILSSTRLLFPFIWLYVVGHLIAIWLFIVIRTLCACVRLSLKHYT